jgi:lyso-ornithine lipid O-acyltransferase
VRSLRATTILFTFLVVTLIGMPWQWSARLFKLRRRKTFPHRYHRFLCKLFGIRVTVIGKPVQDRGVLMVANHTSYLDILILSAAASVSFVAKREVASWPFFGLLAKLQDTVFIDRARRSQAGRSRDAIGERLKNGDALILFPEGTSSDGNRVLSFKSALMGAAEFEIDSDPAARPRQAPVQPVSVAYVSVHGIPMGREMRPLFAWFGNMELVPHLWEALKAGPLDVVVEFHPPLATDAASSRKALARVAEDVVRKGQARALAGHQGQMSASMTASRNAKPMKVAKATSAMLDPI